MNDLQEEKLTRLEEQLIEVIERQRLSRLDTVLLMAYPLVILGISASSYAIVQLKNFGEVTIGAVPLSMLVGYVVFGFGLWGIIGFGTFLRAYLGDNMETRITASALFLFTSIAVVEIIALVTGATFIAAFAWEYVPTLGIGLSVVFDVGGFVTALVLGISLGFSTLFRVERWFTTNLPNTMRKSTIAFPITPGAHRLADQYIKRWSRIGRAAWFGLSLPSYLVIVVLAISSNGMIESTRYHYWSLIGLGIVSIVLAFWRS
jgi:hypothetical protein